jgi:hypothetical protein
MSINKYFDLDNAEQFEKSRTDENNNIEMVDSVTNEPINRPGTSASTSARVDGDVSDKNSCFVSLSFLMKLKLMKFCSIL